MDLARHYRMQAARSRHLAVCATDPELKAHYRGIALHYEQKAEDADRREAETERVLDHSDA